VDTENTTTLHEVDVYTSHEALILGYEEALTRQDSLTGGWYDCSAHMLWIGERTRQLDGAHVEFLRGVGNPIGCKLGPGVDPEYVLELCQVLNPARVPGRLTLITRMGADAVEDALRPLLRAVHQAGHPVVWTCDPMHANTFTTPSGVKTRHLDAIVAEIAGFVRAHRAEGTWPGGIHVELTGENVTECLGGAEELSDTDLDHRYETVCDPRLNARQSLDLAFRVAELVRTTGLA
jgi:3-deoxy-7-phosphoheptulonate synthase